MSNSPFSTSANSSAGLLLWQATTTWQKEIAHALSGSDITHAQFVIIAITLYLIETEGEATQASIIRMSRLDKMTVSTGLRKLESLKLIERYAHHEDTRIYNIRLTNKGVTLGRKLVRSVEAVDKEFFGALTKAEQKILLQLLSRLAS